jgi:hypothetical protein
LSTSGALPGSNTFNYRIKDKFGLWTGWAKEQILVLGELPLPAIDSIKYAIKPSKYSLTGNILTVNFNDTSDKMNLAFKTIPIDTNIVLGTKEIKTQGLSHGIQILSFRAFANNRVVSDIISSDTSAIYQVAVMVDTTIKMSIGEPSLANGTLSTEYCPGGIIKIPIDTTGNWPRNHPGITSTFTVKLSNNVGANLSSIASQMNSTGDTLVATIPANNALGSGFKVMVESSNPMIRDTASSTLTIGLILNATATNPSICEASTLNLGVSSNVLASYSWTGPASYLASGNAPSRINIPVNGGGTYSVSSVSTLAGCTASSIVAITVNPLPIITLGSNSPVCMEQTINLTSSSSGNTFNDWYNGNVGIGGTTGAKSITNVALADSGYYKVSYTSPASCLKTDSVKVTVKPLPVLSGITSNSPICSGNALTFGLNSTAGSSYSWSGPNTFSSTTNSQSISNAGTNASGTYSVAVTLNGCVVNTTFVNVVNQTPMTTVTSPVTICEAEQLQLNINNTPLATYAWSGSLTYSSSTENPIVSASSTSGMSGTYSVTVTLGSCLASSSANVIVKPLPILSGISSNSPICSGNTLTFGLNSTAGSTYSWSGPNTFSSTTNSQSILNAGTNASGTYSVAVTLNGCVVNTTFVNVVNLTPVATVTSPVNVCEGSQLKLNINTTASGIYNWSGPLSFSSSDEDPIVVANAALNRSGTYSVTVSLGSCSATNTVQVTINVVPILLITNQNAQASGNVNLTLPAVTSSSTFPVGTVLSYFSDAAGNNSLTGSNNVTVSGTYYIKATGPGSCSVIRPVIVNICGGIFDPITNSISSGTVSNVSTQKISATNDITGTNTRVTYRSIQYIELLPGFKAEPGAIFISEIGGCP